MKRDGQRATIDYLGEIPIMSLYREPVPAIGRVVKRALDVVGSLFGLSALSPLLLVIGAIIRWDSDGPVFYRCLRMGKKGKGFVCYKFRTMIENADSLKDSLRHLNERDGAIFKISRDPRITRVGKVLRKYSLDELPQLWNVLRGDMSLVGPRPHPMDDYNKYGLEHLRRLDVTPGITGLWQVTARRNPSFEKSVALDVEYIENWSMWMDLSILFRTVFRRSCGKWLIKTVLLRLANDPRITRIAGQYELAWGCCSPALLGLAITHQSLWMDEGSTVWFASHQGIASFFSSLVGSRGAPGDPQMLFYLLYMWGWIKMWGTSEVALRAANIPFAVLLLVTMRWASLRLFARSNAWLLLCLSPFVWFYMNEARPYIAVMSFSTLAVVAMLAYLMGPANYGVALHGVACRLFFWLGVVISWRPSFSLHWSLCL